MPHVTLEYSSNLSRFDASPALAAINRAMLASGLFGEPDIKARAMALDVFRIGTEALPRAFIHVRIALLSGRSEAARSRLANGVLDALSDEVRTQSIREGLELQLSVETVDIDRPSYARTVLHD